MQPPEVDTWTVPEAVTREALLVALGGEFFLDRTPEYAATVVYADTFDWRLYRRGYLLHCHHRAWTLYHGESPEVTVLQDGPELQAGCRIEAFPAGAFRDLLAPILGVRSLLPLATVRLRGWQIRLLNADQKTVARMVVEWQQPGGAGTGHRLLRLFGLRGYDQEFGQICRILEGLGVHQPASPLAGFLAGCQALGRQPLDYSPKFTIELDPADTARTAMARIYLALLDTISRNIPGVLADWDSEFLHDLRVAIRRTRSGLSLVKQVLPEAVSTRFAKVFGSLGNLTGPTRDLDVYLLGQATYRQRLPAALQPGLDYYFADLTRRRHDEQARLARALRSKKYASGLAAWRRTLLARERRPAPLADTPIGDLANTIIAKRYKRILAAGRTLDADTPDAVVHQLRIQCKKLRYAMEFFGSLYPPEEMHSLLRQLKTLQDILGEFNDLSVQQAMLREQLKGLRPGSRQDLEMAAAFGGLMQSLFQEQQVLRGHFAEAFAQFGDPTTVEHVHRIFPKKQEQA